MQDSCENNSIQNKEPQYYTVDESEFIILGTTIKNKIHYFIVESKNTETIHLQKITKQNFDNFRCKKIERSDFE